MQSHLAESRFDERVHDESLFNVCLHHRYRKSPNRLLEVCYVSATSTGTSISNHRANKLPKASVSVNKQSSKISLIESCFIYFQIGNNNLASPGKVFKWQSEFCTFPIRAYRGQL